MSARYCVLGVVSAVDARLMRKAPLASEELQAAGFESLRAIAAGLDERGIPAAHGGKWSATQVARLLEASRPFDPASAAAVA
jgi:hypothetical protein